MGIVKSNSRLNSSQPLSPTPLTLVSTDSISEQKSQGETAKAATDAKAAADSAAPGSEARAVPLPSAAGAAAPGRGATTPDRGSLTPDRGPLMMTAIPGGGETALPGPLEEKRFAGETEGDFEDALKR